MPKFSRSSKTKLDTCYPELQLLFNTVVEKFDCTILCGARSKEDQDKAFTEGRSKLKYPHSKHNVVLPQTLSRAVDVAPYPINWDQLNRFYLFAGYVRRTAEVLGIDIRGGHDWDGDFIISDQTFNDIPHWELKL